MTLPLRVRRRLTKAPFPVRALVGLLTLTAALSLKSLLDDACAYLRASRFVADTIFYAASTPVVVPLMAPMLSFLAPLFDGKGSARPRRSWQHDRSSECDDAPRCTSSWQDDDDVWDSWRDHNMTADWRTDPEYSWFPGNVHHDDS